MPDKRDYTGKIVYTGIDVHKKTYCCASVCEGEVIKRDTMASNPKGFLAYIHKFFSGATVQTAYEAGFAGFYCTVILLITGLTISLFMLRQLKFQPGTASKQINGML